MKENDLRKIVQEAHALLSNIESALGENCHSHRNEDEEVINWEMKEQRIKEYIGDCKSMIIDSMIVHGSDDMTISVLDVFSMLSGIEGLLGDDYSGIL